MARVFSSFLIGLIGSVAVAQVPVAHTSAGDLSGVQADTVTAFLGIPYAAPPVGPGRWRAPQPLAAWKGTRDATRFAASCYQDVGPNGFGPWKHEYVVQGTVSEDCLYLNVWTPKVDPEARLPVLVWIHGGGFAQGSGSVAVYDGTGLAADALVVVTINYRLGVFGFFAHPGLSREAAKAEPPGNYGLEDVIAALKWVHANIAALGGDPGKVTVAGQSAGAKAVHYLIDSPLAAGLFQRAIIESGLPNLLPPLSLRKAEKVGEDFARGQKAPSLAALRALPPQSLLAGAMKPGVRFVPIVDGVLLPQAPGPFASSGRFNDTPVLIGMVADESSAFSPDYNTSDKAAFAALLSKTYGTMAERFRQLYPADTDAERLQMTRQLLRDRGLAALYAWGRDRLAHSHQSVYAYLFTHVEPGPDSARYGAFHSSEIPYAFKTLDKAPERNFTAADRSLSQLVSGYWANFVKNGDPNGPGLPQWPQLSTTDPRIMKLDSDSTAQPLLPERKLQAVWVYLAEGGEPSMF
jgi:para-nitrobenzyl esterase